MTEFLVETHGFDVFNTTNNLGRNAFLLSAEGGKVNQMKYFIKKRPDIINSTDSDKFNALHLSAQFGTRKGSEFLIENHGFNVLDSSNDIGKNSIELTESSNQLQYFNSLL